MPRQIVAWVEPTDAAAPENMESRRYGVGIVQGGNAEIDRFRLMIDLHQERRSTSAAKLAMTEAGRLKAPDVLLAGGPTEIAGGHAGKDHRRRAAIELTGPAMAPARVEGIAQKLVSDASAKASTSPISHAASR